MTEEKRLTPGELVELARGLKDLGALRFKLADFECEFAVKFDSPFVALPGEDDEPNGRSLTPEEYDLLATKARRELEKEVFAAS